MAFATFADAPVDVAVVEVGLGGAWDATNVLAAGVAWSRRSPSTTRSSSATRWRRSREKGRDHQAGRAVVIAAQEPEAAAAVLERRAEVGATVAREGVEFGVLERAVAVGGQVLTLQGLGGVYDEIFLPLHGAHQAQNAAVALAAVEAFFGAGPSGAARRRDGARRLRRRQLARPAGARSAPPRRCCSTPPTTRTGWPPRCAALVEEFDFRRLVGVVGVLADKDVTGMLQLLEPVRRRDRRDPEQLAARACRRRRSRCGAVEVFGADRVHVEPRPDDAIEAAVRLAEEDGTGELAGVRRARHRVGGDRGRGAHGCSSDDGPSPDR